MPWQRADVVGVGDRLADRDVLDAGDGDDVARRRGLGRVAVERAGLQQLGDAHVRVRAVVAHPGDGLALLDGAREDAQQRDAAEERRRVEVRDPRLQRRLVVVLGRRDVLEDRVEQRLEVVVVGERAVLRLVPARGAVATRGVDDGEVEQRVDVEVGHVVVQVARQREQQVVALLDDLVDAGIRAVGLVDQQDDGELRFERLAQHEPGLRQRTLARVDQQHHAIHHRQAALDLAAEVGVAGGVDDVDGHRAVGRVDALVADGGVLREDRDALLALEVVRVHGPLLHVLVRAEGVGLAQHGVDERRLAVVDVGDDRDVAQVGAGGGCHGSTSRRRMGLEPDERGQTSQSSRSAPVRPWPRSASSPRRSRTRPAPAGERVTPLTSAETAVTVG